MTLNNETKFPESYMTLYAWNEHENSYGTDEVKDWFKRCTNDIPESINDLDPFVDLVVLESWVKKWFSQFKEE